MVSYWTLLFWNLELNLLSELSEWKVNLHTQKHTVAIAQI